MGMHIYIYSFFLGSVGWRLHPLDMGLLMCLKQPLVLIIIVAPFETFLPYIREKKKLEIPPPTPPLHPPQKNFKSKKQKIHFMFPWAGIRCDVWPGPSVN